MQDQAAVFVLLKGEFLPPLLETDEFVLFFYHIIFDWLFFIIRLKNIFALENSALKSFCM